jgi:hypothetical protein
MEQLAGGAQVLSLLGRLRQTVLGERDAEVSSDSRQP